ncbi:hypothetical protein J4G33_15670 [Actinotalea sp. BY-33]|uniref:YgjV family protein n=1 Tax=Actinotalea soli TaxID=2819234 RepID=A0A939LRK0_9CELL|nr:hypothetical protein [Actinotalea soli]MBO1753246.1 hypothetical protein [Actinotalea soli]
MPVVEAIGWFGSAFLVFSIMQTRVMRFRVLNTTACVILIGYNAAIGVWPMVAMNVALTVINLWIIVRLLRERHDSRAYDVVPMAADEPFLAHLLDRHAADVAAFNPGLTPEAVRSAEHAFVVSTGDQVVGVVLSRAGDHPGEQQVVLDYVLPAYRDFTPGEFVFRPGGPFAALGTRRVVASPGMQASERYLRAVGFVQQGDRSVLDLTPA